MQINPIQWIELFSALLGVAGVWLNTKPNILGWPIGIVSVVLAAFVYFQTRLFAEFGLQIFYAISGFYGWWQWFGLQGKNENSKISGITFKGLIISLVSGIGLTFLIGNWLRNNTSADFPWVDSGLAAFSLIAQIWLAKKYLENWLLWMVINLISIGLYFVKGLWFFLALYLFYFFLAILGYKNWKILLNRKT